MNRGSSYTASLLSQADRGDLSVFTIHLTGSGIWTLVNDADGIDLLTSPTGYVYDLTDEAWPSATPQVAAIQAWIERYF